MLKYPSVGVCNELFFELLRGIKKDTTNLQFFSIDKQSRF